MEENCFSCNSSEHLHHELLYQDNYIHQPIEIENYFPQCTDAILDLTQSVSSQVSSYSQTMEINRRVRELNNEWLFQPTSTNVELHHHSNTSTDVESISPSSSDLIPPQVSSEFKSEKIGSCPVSSHNIKVKRQLNSTPDNQTNLSFSKTFLVNCDPNQHLIKDKIVLLDCYGRPAPMAAIPLDSITYLNILQTLQQNYKRLRVSAPKLLKTPEQVALLESEFKRNPYPTKEQRLKLTEKSGLSDARIRLWFQYRRNKSSNHKRAHRPQLSN